jgi:hypothetical protein
MVPFERGAAKSPAFELVRTLRLQGIFSASKFFQHTFVHFSRRFARKGDRNNFLRAPDGREQGKNTIREQLGFS